MVYRRRRQTAPHFRIPVPYNPIEGKFAALKNDVRDGIPFTCDMDVPAYGVMVKAGRINSSSYIYGHDCPVLRTRQVYIYSGASSEVSPGPFFINGSTGVPAGVTGYCYPADGTPRRVLVNPTAAWFTDWSHFNSQFAGMWYGAASGTQWGPIPGSWSLGVGLPGFFLTGNLDEDSSTSEAIASPVPMLWGRATENWRYGFGASLGGFHFRVNPSVFPGTSILWDGSGGRQDIEVMVWISSAAGGANSLSRRRCPNIEAGDDISCHPNYPFLVSADEERNNIDWFPIGEYLDDPVGTIKFIAINESPPRGWAIMDGDHNSFGNGGSGIDAVTDNPFVRINSTQMGVTGDFSFTRSGGDFTTEIPYIYFVPIERLDNSGGEESSWWPWS